MKSLLIILSVTGSLLGGHAIASQDDNLNQFKELLATMEARIAVLESRITFASFMPDLAERFHVMHRAGETGDWAVASHELQTMKQLMQLSSSIDTDKGNLMIAMLEPSFEALEHAIEKSDHGKFEKALDQTINTCNACHTATGSSFVQVTLDAGDSLSMRHPHKFVEQKAPLGHAHGMPSGMSGMTGVEPASGERHDEASESDHQDDENAPAHSD